MLLVALRVLMYTTLGVHITLGNKNMFYIYNCLAYCLRG